MNDPYDVLGVSRDADEAAIRQRYLQLVREFPPEREPQRFAEIRAAYDHLRDPVVNLENRLFAMQAAESLDALARRMKPDVRGRRIATRLLLSLAQP